MNALRQDMFQSGVRDLVRQPGNFDGGMLYYVMSHWPGQAPTSYKRLVYAALGHGTKVLDLYEFHSTFGTTENSVGEYRAAYGTYEMALDTMYEYGQFDDIIQASPSQAAPVGDVALYFSTAADAWEGDHTTPCIYSNGGPTDVRCRVFKAAKRALYIALRHQHLSVDVINEADVSAKPGKPAVLGRYKTLYIADPHVSSAATEAIAAWVSRGGTLYATASAGMYDEANAVNTAMMGLLGLTAAPVVEFGPPLAMLKRDLPTAQPLDRVTLHTAGGVPISYEVFGAVVRPTNASVGVNATVVARYSSDLTPAATVHPVGDGHAVFIGHLPTISYFKPALPNRPIDICPQDGDDGCFCHFVPSGFDQDAISLLNIDGDAKVAPLYSASDPLVEVNVLDAGPRVGGVVLLTNWRMVAVTDGSLEVSIAASALSSAGTGMTATAHRASDGTQVTLARQQDGTPDHNSTRWRFTLPGTLVVADALVIRP